MIRTAEEVEAIAEMDEAAKDALDLLERAIEQVNNVPNVNYYRLPLKRAVSELRAVYRRDSQGAA